MQEAYINDYWYDIVSFIRSLLNSTFKTNPWLERGIMTGITRISKESVFSDLNNLEVITTTSDKYADAFGFTQAEVFDSMDEFGLSQNDEVKSWYDGFTFGSVTDIYNPWSILNFLNTGKFKTYWANTSSNSLISRLLREGNKSIKQSFERLLNDENISVVIDEQVIYNQLDENTEAVWSLLLSSGYLRVVSVDEPYSDYSISVIKYEVALTNYEVKRMFTGMVRGWFGKISSDYNDFVNALLSDDLNAMSSYINRVSSEIFSYFDTGKRKSQRAEPERFYHGFVLGLIVDLAGRYAITLNRESGLGRYDVLLEPLNSDDNAIIIEFKVRDPESENDLKATVDEALRQIKDKSYAQVLISKGIDVKRIYKYGFAFEGKTILIGKK